MQTKSVTRHPTCCLLCVQHTLKFLNIVFHRFLANHGRDRKTYLTTTIQTAVSGCFPGLSLQVYDASVVAGWADMSANNLSALQKKKKNDKELTLGEHN